MTLLLSLLFFFNFYHRLGRAIGDGSSGAS